MRSVNIPAPLFMVCCILLLLTASRSIVQAAAPKAAVLPMTTTELFTIPTCRMPGQPGALLYHRFGEFFERVKGIRVVDEVIYVWDAARVLAFTPAGTLRADYALPDNSIAIRHVVIDAQQKVYVSIDTDDRVLYQFSPADKEVIIHKLSQQVTTSAGLFTVDAHSRLWVQARRAPTQWICMDEKEALPPYPCSTSHCGAYLLQAAGEAREYIIQLLNAQGMVVGEVRLPLAKYSDPRLLRYFDDESYVGVFGKEPEQRRTLTLFTVAPQGITQKITIPAAVLFGGMERCLMPNGVKYCIDYDARRHCYVVTSVHYQPADLGLATQE